LIGCACTFTSGAYTVTAGAFVRTEACASAGTLISDGAFCWCRCALAMAGDASKAATPTADRMIFKFDVMFNLMFQVARGPTTTTNSATHKTFRHHEIVLII
jgi:hypothetical protein